MYANAFFGEHHKAVQNNVVSRTPGIKFWMLLEARTVRSITSAASVSFSFHEARRRHIHGNRRDTSVSARWDGIEGPTLLSPRSGREPSRKFSRGAAPSRGRKKYKPSSLSAVHRAHQSRDVAVHGLYSRRTSQPRRTGCLNPVPPDCRHCVEQNNAFAQQGSQLSAQRIDADLQHVR